MVHAISTLPIIVAYAVCTVCLGELDWLYCAVALELLFCCCLLAPVREVKLEVPVTDYFHEDGYLAEKTFRRRVGKVLQQYEQVDVQSDISTPRPKALNPKKHE